MVSMGATVSAHTFPKMLCRSFINFKLNKTKYSFPLKIADIKDAAASLCGVVGL